MLSKLSMKSKYLTMILMAANTTDGLIWDNLGKILSIIDSASAESAGV